MNQYSPIVADRCSTERRHTEFNLRAEELHWPMRSDPALNFVAPVLRQALAVWREKAGRRRLASRHDMTPHAMKPFLRHLAIIELVRADDGLRYRARVTGTELSRVLGNYDGQFLDSVIPSPQRERWEAMLRLCLDVCSPVRTESVLEFRQQTYLNIETLFAPLSGADRTPCAILVVAVASPRDFCKDGSPSL